MGAEFSEVQFSVRKSCSGEREARWRWNAVPEHWNAMPERWHAVPERWHAVPERWNAGGEGSVPRIDAI